MGACGGKDRGRDKASPKPKTAAKEPAPGPPAPAGKDGTSRSAAALPAVANASMVTRDGGNLSLANASLSALGGPEKHHRFGNFYAEEVSQLEHTAQLNIYKDPPAEPVALVPYLRANKIICTIGPKTQPVEQLKELLQAGMSVVRNNFSHGTHEYHATTIANARQAARELGLEGVAIALDTKGPEIRTGNFPGGEVQMEVGDTTILTTDRDWYDKGTKEKFYVDYTNITKVIGPGQHVYIDDGLLCLQVEDVQGCELHCKVVNAAPVGNHKGVNLPNVAVDLPAVTEKDRKDLQFGAEQGVDLVFASFIRTAQQVRDVRAALGEKGRGVQIIAKIENHEGVTNFNEILAEADGVMVARGDLGIEIPAQKVFIAQKMMIARCNLAGKPVICATQMLESMVGNPRPTRAEVSDVANAVLDGADCVMLSGETAKGKYPAECVRTMARICSEAQAATQNTLMRDALKEHQQQEVKTESFMAHSRLMTEQQQAIEVAKRVSVADAVAEATVATAQEIGARCIIALTQSGTTARLLAKYRPPCPVICVTKDARACRLLAVSRSCHAFSVPPEMQDASPSDAGYARNREERIGHAVQRLKKEGLLAPGHVAVVMHADNQTLGYANQSRVITIS